MLNMQTLGRFSIVLLAMLVGAQITIGQQVRRSPSKLIRILPVTTENPRVDVKLLRRGSSVLVHAIISKSGDVTSIKFLSGNADLMPEVRKELKTWQFKPYIYHGQVVDVETVIHVNFDLLIGG